jgi:transposase InsO family protein
MEQRTMSLKMDFVRKAMKQYVRMSPLCREFGISRETGYKWLNRYKREGYDGLEERSRRPKCSPLAAAEDLVLSILELREAYPRRGPKKLFVLLQRKFGAVTPSIATIARVLRRFGKVRQRSKFRRLSIVERAPNFVPSACNELWTVDFKGWWRAQDGERCEPLTVRDAFSRYVLALKVLAGTSLEPTKAVFVELFRRLGMPLFIQVDNGTPFINVRARGGLTQLSAWWISLGITVIRSRPGCPQDNGGHERMHRDIREDLQALPAGSRATQQRACDRWKQEFNHVRPHEALRGKTPAELYKPSERRVHKSHYLYPPSWVVRTVTAMGAVNVNRAQAYAGLALQGQRVGLEPLQNGRFKLWFHTVDLGELELGISDTVTDEVSQRFLARYGKKAA